MNVDYKGIGSRIQGLRLNLNMTQERLASMIGVSIPHMSNMENGKTKFSLQVLVDLAEALNTGTDYLLFGIGTGSGLDPNSSVEKKRVCNIIARHMNKQQKLYQQLNLDIENLFRC